MWAAAMLPSALTASTSFSEPQVPPVSVRPKLIVVEVLGYPSKLLIVWLNTPNELTLPDPPLEYGPALKPTSGLLPVIVPRVKEVAFTFTSTERPSPSRYRSPPLLKEVNVIVACVESTQWTSTCAKGPVNPESAAFGVPRSKIRSAIAGPLNPAASPSTAIAREIRWPTRCPPNFLGSFVPG